MAVPAHAALPRIERITRRAARSTIRTARSKQRGLGPGTHWWKFAASPHSAQCWASLGRRTLDAETRCSGAVGFAIVQGYGMTGRVAHQRQPTVKMSHGSIGKLGSRVKVTDGEILVRGPNIPRVLGREGAQEGGGSGGDIGVRREGNLYFKGRKKDVIVTGAGMNVYPGRTRGGIPRSRR